MNNILNLGFLICALYEKGMVLYMKKFEHLAANYSNPNWNNIISRNDVLYKRENDFRSEFSATEGNILWSYAPAEEIPERALTAECTRELLDFLLFTPTGALKRHHLNPHQVLGSALIKCADLKDGVFTGNYTIRSNTDPYKYLLAQKFCRLCDRYGVIWKKTGDDPAWPENPVSSLTKLCLDVYEKRFGCKPACELVHGGEEASIVSYCIPDMEIVGIAPYSRGAHTPKERLYLDTVLPVWQFLTDLLAQLSER